MPAQWTGQLIGEIHNSKLTILQVSKKAGLHPKYVSAVLNSEGGYEKAKGKLFSALEDLKKEKIEKEREYDRNSNL